MNQHFDQSQPKRIRDMIEMVHALSNAQTPDEVLAVFSKRRVEDTFDRSGYISLSTRNLSKGHFRITRFLTADDWNQIQSMPPWKESSDLPIHNTGFFADLVSNEQPVVYTNLDIINDPVFADILAPYKSLIAVPLYEHGKINNWAIEISQAPSVYDEDSLEDMLLKANLVGGTVRHVITTRKLQRANHEIEMEVKRIADIQRALLPASLPDLPDIKFAVSYETFDHAGGDMYFFHSLADGRLAIMIGDVAGHGPAAAVVMAMVETLVSAYPQETITAGEMLSFLNDQLCSKHIQNTFVTAFYAIYDPIQKTLRFSRAGHPPPLLRSIGQPVEYCILNQEIEEGQISIQSLHPPQSFPPKDNIIVQQLDHAGGLPLGLFPHKIYEEAVIRLHPGQTIAFYTDGITDTRNPDGSFFGVSGIQQALHECSGETECAVSTIMQHVRDFESGARPTDDQTLVVMRLGPDDAD
ncbi:serine/threonine-protein phosphatase [Planctomycetota bacterium]|nr:serine/threonine-protein phosphatase [Planctomycetota bacterium]